MKTHSILFGLVLLMFCACDKDAKTIEFEQIPFEGLAPIRVFQTFGDTIVAGGGEKNASGFISVAHLDALDFKLVKSDFKSPVYSVEKYADRYWVGLDETQLNQSLDLTKFEPYYFNEKDWVGSLYQQPIRKMARVGNDFLAIAGGELSKGVIYQSSDSTRSWNPIEIDHELRALATIQDSISWKAWVGGNGILLSKTNSDSDWKRIDLEDVFIVDMVFESFSLGWLVSYDGHIMKTKNGGQSWTEVHKPKGSRYINRIRYENGHFVVVAQDGMIAHSTNGESWQWYDLDTQQDLLDVWIDADHFIVGTDMGEVYRISFSNL
jgi:hypothetical protein